MVASCVPLIHASNLAELAAYYRRVLTFDLIQQIPGVFALVGLIRCGCNCGSALD